MSNTKTMFCHLVFVLWIYFSRFAIIKGWRDPVILGIAERENFVLWYLSLSILLSL